jgi:hypothetical protein
MFLDMNNIFSYYFRVRFVVIIAIVERATLSLLYFFLLCVAERTFKEVSFLANNNLFRNNLSFFLILKNI